jgi:hypothetical protein
VSKAWLLATIALILIQKSATILLQMAKQNMTQVNYPQSAPPYTVPVDKPDYRFLEGTRLCEDSPSLKI